MRVYFTLTRRELAALGGTEIVDIVADVNPGVPWCWSVLTLHRANAQPMEALTATRATLSLLPGVWPAASCASPIIGTDSGSFGFASRAMTAALGTSSCSRPSPLPLS